MRISDWSSDVCSSDLDFRPGQHQKIVVALLVETKVEPAAIGGFVQPVGLDHRAERAVGDEDALGGFGLECIDNAHAAAFSALICPRTPSRRSEEHTSELQSLMRISYAVFFLKKKTRLNPHEANATTPSMHTVRRI